MGNGVVPPGILNFGSRLKLKKIKILESAWLKNDLFRRMFVHKREKLIEDFTNFLIFYSSPFIIKTDEMGGVCST